jgi:hypothetical protein
MYASRCDGRDGSPVEPEPGVFGWLVSALRYDDDLWLLQHRGLDALVYSMLIRHMMYAVVPCMIFTFLIVVPVYATSTHPDIQVTGLTLITMANVPSGSDRLW